jgi:hypothetical protein
MKLLITLFLLTNVGVTSTQTLDDLLEHVSDKYFQQNQEISVQKIAIFITFFKQLESNQNYPSYFSNLSRVEQK